MENDDDDRYVLVVRKPCFDLPTACPDSLPVYIYLKMANIDFDTKFNLTYPDSDQIPYIEFGTCVAYNNEKGGVIDSLKVDEIVNLDGVLSAETTAQLESTKAMISSWLADAVMYELWMGGDRSQAYKIYFSDLPWPIGRILQFKKSLEVKQVLGITKLNAERREEEIYRRATIAYNSLSTMLGEEKYFADNRPTSLDAVFLGHALFTLHVLPETSQLRAKLLDHANLVRYSENLKFEFLEPDISSVPGSLSNPSSSSVPRRRPQWRSRVPPRQPKREKTYEEKKFIKRGKFFLAAQVISVLIYLSLAHGGDAELEEDNDAMDYDD
ncbi:hypothetical protein ACHQM5_030373 [Ranunculus cassubicifolius]